MASFDTSLFGAVNGDAGGTWAPAAQIVLGGSGLSVTGPSAFSNITAATLNGTLTVTSGNGITLNSGATLTLSSGSTSTMAGSASLTLSNTASIAFTGTSLLSVGSTAVMSITGAVTFAGAGVTYDSSTTINYSGATASGKLTRTGQTILSGQAAIGWRSVTIVDTNQTLDAAAYDVVFVPAAIAGSSKTVLMSVPTNSAHAIVRFTRQSASGSFSVLIANHDGVLLASLPNTASPWAEFYFDGTDWVLVRTGTGS
jgi:hypothetical protein